MFEQLVDAFRWLDILHGLFVMLITFSVIATVVLFVFAAWHSFHKGGESQSSPYSDNVGGFTPWLWALLSCVLWSSLAFVNNAVLPTREYIVMKAVAPQVDKYVKEHPETLLKVENLVGIVDDTAKSVLNLVGDSSKLVRGYLEKQVQGAIDPTGEIRANDKEAK